MGDAGGSTDAAPLPLGDAEAEDHDEAPAWRPISRDGAPIARVGEAVVWTGGRMIVWGGVGCPIEPCDMEHNPTAMLDTGAWFDPALDAWGTISSDGAPSPRLMEAFVWAGDRMLIWSGEAHAPKGGVYPPPLEDGAWYSPADNTWEPAASEGGPARAGAQAVWTGADVLLWGGGVPDDPLEGLFRSFHDGARIDPDAGAWRALPPVDMGAEDEVTGPFVVWTGAEMIVWDGRRVEAPRPGWRFDPVTETWSPMASHDADDRSCGVVWIGTELLAFGHASFSRYDPVTDRWTVSPWDQTLCATPLWTGREVLLWRPSGSPPGASLRFDPADESTRPIETEGAPSPRRGFASFWTGEEMLIWGGADDETAIKTNTGYLYRPPQP